MYNDTLHNSKKKMLVNAFPEFNELEKFFNLRKKSEDQKYVVYLQLLLVKQ